MAKVDDLIERVPDAALRKELESATAQLKRRQRFGLVFEEHIPETTALAGVPIRVGSLVQRRRDLEGKALFRVKEVSGRTAELDPTDEREEPRPGEQERLPMSELLLVKRFGEPIYPLLKPLGRIAGGGPERPFHTVINGENFHALQLLVYLLEGQADCIYIDPPYNTGARDWKYNNRFVDKNDAWQHSKWLAMMARRLRLAKRLLRTDSVLIVTVDENEVHHLGMLLEDLFPDARRQMISLCINPSGASGEGLSRVGEYAFFCFLGRALPVATSDDMLNEIREGGSSPIEWESLLRRGNVWYRSLRPNLCYPILIDPDTSRIIGAGKPFEGRDEKRRPRHLDGYPVAWPVRRDMRLGIWRVDSTRLSALAEKGYAYVTNRDESRGTWTIKYLMSGTIEAIESGLITVDGRGKHGEVILRSNTAGRTIAKTIWHRGRHTAGGAGGTQALATLLGRRGAFPFPKSVYAVRDCLEVAVGDRRNALILDFFAGSGTTMHATCLLNGQDNGARQCILVTNNEVDLATAARLYAAGHFRGDLEFERHGIFEAVTRPRCEAVVTGISADGKQLPKEMAGFPENVEFFELGYADHDNIDLRRHDDALLSLIWLAAGATGARDEKYKLPFSMPKGGRYAILFDERRFRTFAQALWDRPDVTQVWLVTDSEAAYAEMRSRLPPRVRSSMLYRDYLRGFRLNVDQFA